jgi:hypothetical protein
LSDEKHRPNRNDAGAGEVFDKNGKAGKIGDLYRASDGRVYKMHGYAGERQPGTNAEYARDIEWVSPNTPWTDSAVGLSVDDQTIIWGS